MPIKFKQCLPSPDGCGQSLLRGEFWKDPKEPDGLQRRCASCVKAKRRERSQTRAAGEEVQAYSPERRADLAQRARDLHAQGKLGGSEFGKLGGRPRKPRIAEAVLEHFRDGKKMDLVIAAYEGALRSRNRSLRLRAAEALGNLEQVEDKRQRDARGSGRDPADLSPEELEEFLVQGIAAMIERGELTAEGLAGFDVDLPAEAVRELA